MDDDIKANLKDHFQKVILALFEPILEYEAHHLKLALKDRVYKVHDVRIIIQILCTKSANEIKQLEEVYQRCYFIYFKLNFKYLHNFININLSIWA